MWNCSCGTANSDNYSVCQNCGKTKDASKKEKKKSSKKIIPVICILGAVICVLIILLTVGAKGKEKTPSTTTTHKTTNVAETYVPANAPTPATQPPVRTAEPTQAPSTPTPLISEQEVRNAVSKLTDPPKSTECFAEYELATIKAPKGQAIYAYGVHKVVVNGQSAASKIFDIPDGAEVIVIAYNEGNDRYCVIVKSTGKAGWVNADYIC